MQQHHSEKPSLGTLALAAVGIVYGDIGTSPLYTMKECFTGPHGLAATPENILGILSLILWSIIFVVTLKYVVFIMRADNRGEGGILALMALALRSLEDNKTKSRVFYTMLGIFGAALFYGDGIITPAISVLSAVEGLEILTPSFKPYILPVTIAVLVMLFLIQKKGTESVGRLFGPIMTVWFISLAILGIVNLLKMPQVLQAFNPLLGIQFFLHDPWHSFLALGAVVLALTGGEALYADMGHFGRRPIKYAWFCFVLPALGLNYLGQAALLLKNPAAVQNPFFLLAPSWALLPLVILATAATVIASQAVISGAFSLTRQAIQLGFCPRMEILHTSEKEIGQIYVPVVNWGLLGCIIFLVFMFQSSSNLAAAYGIAVTGTMVATTLLAFPVTRYRWNWPLWASLSVTTFFLSLDLAFFSANAMKIMQGGWFPLVVGAISFTFLTTWKRGRQILFERLNQDGIPLTMLIESLEAHPPVRVQGTAIFMTGTPDSVPHALLHNLKHNKILHERIVLLTVKTEDIPFVKEEERIGVSQLSPSFWRVTARFGFKEDPHVPQILDRCAPQGLEFDMMDTSFFLSRETLKATEAPGMAMWREHLFVSMSQNAMRATDFFKIPTNRVVELGTQVEL